MALKDLRVLRLQAEKVKRINVIDITPPENIVTIKGKNGHGKTSVLDCIRWALGGTSGIQFKPIKEGEEAGYIQLDLGNDEGMQLQVTRRFTGQDDGTFTTSLKLVTGDGMRPQGEQTLLNNLITALSLDPGEFIRAKPAEQVKILKDLIPDADFDAIAAERKKAFDDRTEANREEKRLRSQALAIPEDVVPVLARSVEALEEELGSIGQATAEYERERLRRAGIDSDIEDLVLERDDALEAIDELREKIRHLQGKADLAERSAGEKRLELSALPTLVVPASDADIRSQLTEARQIMLRHDRQQARLNLITEADETKEKSDGLTATIEKLDKDVLDLIAGADLPVSGLALKDDMVYLRGVPFDQASDAEQLRAALALCIASNPKLRVIRIRDGERFDDEAMAIIREVAVDENFQIWVEAVRGFGEPDEIIMEAGEVKNG